MRKIKVVAKALDVSDKNKLRHWDQWQAELYRLQGELHLRQWGDQLLTEELFLQVESYFQQAIVIARQQQAKSTELRATMSLSRLWLRQGKPAAAYLPLAAVYQWFTEGFDTADLREAKLLLAELSASM